MAYFTNSCGAKWFSGADHPTSATAPSPDGVSAVASVCFPGARWIEKDRGNSVVEREGENEKEMHGQMGLKWQQSALMETDGRMRR